MKLTSRALDNGIPVSSRDSVSALIEEGIALEKQGRAAEAMARYDAAIKADPQCARAHLNRGNVLFADARISEARSAYQEALVCDPHYAAAHFNLGNLNCRAGEHERGLQNYQAALGIRSDWADAFLAIGNALHDLGRTSEAMESYQRALAISPDYAEVHFNLGSTAATAGRYGQAAASLRRAIDLRPDYAAAHYALGRLSIEIGHLGAAEASLRHALSIEPEAEQVVSDLATVLQLCNKAPEAIQLTLRYLERTPTSNIKRAFVNCVARTSFSVADDPLLRPALTSALKDAWAVPYEVCRPALSLIMLDPMIAGCVRLANEKWPARLPKSELLGPANLAALGADSLLHALLEAVPVSTVEFERFLTATRHALLETANSDQPPAPADGAALRFYSALARQCFINEYIFDSTGTERATAAACHTRLLALLNTDTIVPPLLLLAVAAYYPLYTLPKASRLLTATQPDPVKDLLRQQVCEPIEEQALRVGVERLTAIARGVSEKVRDQYEEHPYPRWVKVPILNSALPFNVWLRRMFPRALFTPLPDDSQPEMLVAGCGTGSQPISVTQAIRGVRALAIDLSLSSISYAIRKTQELGITNIAYAQADILKLGDVARTFDIVASMGVLHHLADPFAGWRILLSRLRPGGFMHLGFYSKLARSNVIKAREFVAAHSYASTPEDIRRFRRDLFERGSGAEYQWLSTVPDFYSTSECRDLVFHVQEHCLTLEQIASFLAESGLKFIGFDLDYTLLHQYRRRYVDDRSATNLRNWAQFEADNPHTFIGMYRFWIQKPIGR